MGLPVLIALGLGTLPARALPSASVQLFRINGEGVRPMPAIGDALDRAQRQKTAQAQPFPVDKPVLELVAQSGPASLGSLSNYSQSFVGPLPANLSGNLRIVFIDPNTGTIGQVLEEIDVNGANVLISPDRLKLTVQLQPTSTIQPGQTVMLQLPSISPTGEPILYPNHLATTPCQFTVTAVSALPLAPAPLAAAPVAAAPGAAAAAPAVGAPAPLAAAPVAVAAGAAAGLSPLLIFGAVVLVGVGAAAAAGAFSGGGGTNTSSQ